MNHFDSKIIPQTIEISVKSRKDTTSTLSLVIHRVRLKKNPQTSILAFKGGVKLRKPPCLSFVLESLYCRYIDFHCSYMYSYYNSSQTLCIQCWDSAFHSEDLINFPYFMDTTKRGVRGWKEAQRQGDFKDICNVLNIFC